ncbi:MAG: hypothetical protein ACXAEF_07480 [Candidatus Thorarchaeota archaeon]|jgi:hypothetical protein
MAILFDLHHTLTMLTEDVSELWRRMSEKNGIDLSSVSNEEIW